jgi:lysophospholipase L1-like esterase
LSDSKGYINSWGGELYFIYLPELQRYSQIYSKYSLPEIAGHDAVIGLVKALDIPVIDVTEDFDAHPDPTSLFALRSYAHYNKDGYKLVADSVLQSVQLD